MFKSTGLRDRTVLCCMHTLTFRPQIHCRNERREHATRLHVEGEEESHLDAWIKGRRPPTPRQVIISEGASRSHKVDREHCRLSEARNPVRKNPRQILLFSKFGAQHLHRTNEDLGAKQFIHSFIGLSQDRPKASSKASSPHSAIYSFFLQIWISTPFLKVIQELPKSSSSSSCHFYPSFYLSFNNLL
jgi:hypothetical protein